MGNKFRIQKEENISKTLRFPSSIIKKIEELAHQNDLSFNQVVVQCCEYALSNLDSEEDNFDN